MLFFSKEERVWGTFKPNNSFRYRKTHFLLLHDEHCYGVKGVSKVVLYDHSYSFINKTLSSWTPQSYF